LFKSADNRAFAGTWCPGYDMPIRCAHEDTFCNKIVLRFYYRKRLWIATYNFGFFSNLVGGNHLNLLVNNPR
jgi:hypothetical protein